MSTKQVKGVFVPRHDTAINWSKAVNFTPKKGELIVFDADTNIYNTSVSVGGKSYPVTSSDKVRFKFGDGTLNVNALPFATTANSGGGSGLTEEEIIALINEHSSSDSAIAYLDTEEHVGRTIELHDVYPIQSDDTVIKVVSKNRFKLSLIYEDYHVYNSVDGVEIHTCRPYGDIDYDGLGGMPNAIVVMGQATSTIRDTYIDLGEVVVDAKCKYTISVRDRYGQLVNGIGHSPTSTSTKRCYVVYSLYDSDDNLIQNVQTFESGYVTIDSKELGVSKIKVQLFISVPKGSNFNVEHQIFGIQVEYGESPTAYVPNPPLDDTTLPDVVICGKNTYTGDAESLWLTHIMTYDNVTNTTEEITLNSIGTNYIHGTLYVEGQVLLNLGEVCLYTTLGIGDDYTLAYNVTGNKREVGNDVYEYEINNIQILYGHVDYSEYEEPDFDSISPGDDGVIDASFIRYPYSVISVGDFDITNGYTLYAKYDAALSKDWTEQQLHVLDEQIQVLDRKIDGNTIKTFIKLPGSWGLYLDAVRFDYSNGDIKIVVDTLPYKGTLEPEVVVDMTALDALFNNDKYIVDTQVNAHGYKWYRNDDEEYYHVYSPAISRININTSTCTLTISSLKQYMGHDANKYPESSVFDGLNVESIELNLYKKS